MQTQQAAVNGISVTYEDKGPKDAAVIELTGVYHNLLRRWSEV